MTNKLEEIIISVKDEGPDVIDVIDIIKKLKVGNAVKFRDQILLQSPPKFFIKEITCNNYISNGICNSTGRVCPFIKKSFEFSATFYADHFLIRVWLSKNTPCFNKKIKFPFEIKLKGRVIKLLKEEELF